MRQLFLYAAAWDLCYNQYMFKYLSGFIFGIIFGYVLKRSRFCLTGLIRDVYLEKQRYNILLMFGIIGLEGFIYYLFRQANLVQLLAYLPPFSLIAVAVGSFIFGFGAVMAKGCLTSALVKCGDGRITGWISIAAFMVSAYIVSAGFGTPVSKALRRTVVVSDDFAVRTTAWPLLIFGAACIIILPVLISYSGKQKRRFVIPGRYTGFRHVLFEKPWPKEVAVIVIGCLLGLAFFVSELTGRHYGVALASPLMSWIYTFTKPAEILGGCNSYDQVLGWGSMLIIGLILGVFITTVFSGEFSVVKPTKKGAVFAALGGALMGAGAMWGLGCLLGNGLVGTAQLSVKSWYALCFLIPGIFCAAKIFYKGLNSGRK